MKEKLSKFIIVELFSNFNVFLSLVRIEFSIKYSIKSKEEKYAAGSLNNEIRQLNGTINAHEVK